MNANTVSTALTRDHAKLFNQHLVLRQVYEQSGVVSRAQIAGDVSLSKTTVSAAIDELVEQGLVLETGKGESSGGKPPTLISFNDQAQEIVVISLSRELYDAAHFDLRLGFKQKTGTLNGISVPATDDGLIAVIGGLIDERTVELTAPLLGIGILYAPQVYSHILDFDNIADALSKRYETIVRFIPTGPAAAMGAAIRWKRSNVISLMLDMTGYQAGIVLDGQPLYRHLAGGIGMAKVAGVVPPDYNLRQWLGSKSMAGTAVVADNAMTIGIGLACAFGIPNIAISGDFEREAINLDDAIQEAKQRHLPEGYQVALRLCAPSDLHLGGGSALLARQALGVL